MPIETYKSFGVIALALFWAAVCVLIVKFRGHAGMTISKHAASHKLAFAMMAVVGTVSYCLLIIFTLKWFVPTFNLPSVFGLGFAVALTGFLLAAWIPDSTGKKSRIHGALAYVGTILLIPLTTILYLSSEVSAFAKVYALITVCYMVACMASLYTLKITKKYKLYLQIFYFLLFDTLLLVVTYIR